MIQSPFPTVRRTAGGTVLVSTSGLGKTLATNLAMTTEGSLIGEEEEEEGEAAAAGVEVSMEAMMTTIAIATISRLAWAMEMINGIQTQGRMVSFIFLN